MQLTRRHGAVAVGGFVCLLGVATSLPAQAAKEGPVRGDFTRLTVANPMHALPGLSGRAQLVRTGSGTTKLSVRMKGLTPGATYGVHLHNAPCNAANPGGGHYQDIVSTTDDKLKRPPNELWGVVEPGRPRGRHHRQLRGERHRARCRVVASSSGGAVGRGPHQPQPHDRRGREGRLRRPALTRACLL